MKHRLKCGKGDNPAAESGSADSWTGSIAADAAVLLAVKEKGITDHHYHSFIHRRYSGTSWRRDVGAV